MSDVIEVAKSGRASCRVCKSKIEKDAWRFGQQVVTQFSAEPGMQWFHLPCAAKKVPLELRAALASFAGDVPDRAALEQTIEASKDTEKPSTLPYADRAPTGRARCLGCNETIEKDALRVAIERAVPTGAFGAKSAGYLHPACVAAYVAGHPEAGENLSEQIQRNSRLATDQLTLVLEAIR